MMGRVSRSGRSCWGGTDTNTGKSVERSAVMNPAESQVYVHCRLRPFLVAFPSSNRSLFWETDWNFPPESRRTLAVKFQVPPPLIPQKKRRNFFLGGTIAVLPWLPASAVWRGVFWQRCDGLPW